MFFLIKLITYAIINEVARLTETTGSTLVDSGPSCKLCHILFTLGRYCIPHWDRTPLFELNFPELQKKRNFL